jgi:hypothetical protein
MDANAMMNGGHVRHNTVLAEAKAKNFSKEGNRPADVQQDVAGPILNTVAVRTVLRQALYEFREEYDWRQHKKYDTSPDDGLHFTEYGIDELTRHSTEAQTIGSSPPRVCTAYARVGGGPDVEKAGQLGSITYFSNRALLMRVARCFSYGASPSSERLPFRAGSNPVGPHHVGWRAAMSQPPRGGMRHPQKE